MNVERTNYEIACPDCGKTAIYESITQRVAMYTGEMEDDDWPAVETVTASGFTVKCAYCGFADGEPPQW